MASGTVAARTGAGGASARDLQLAGAGPQRRNAREDERARPGPPSPPTTRTAPALLLVPVRRSSGSGMRG